MRFQDLTGKRFACFVVLRHHSRDRQKDGATCHRWECKCDCGNTFVARGEYIKYWKKPERLCKKCATNPHKHLGLTSTGIGSIWRGIISRCENPKNAAYARYGARGVCMCSGWRESIPKFSSDMGPRPSKEHSVDRIDGRGNYSCGKCDECVSKSWTANCRWATQQDQILNSTIPRFVEHGGESLSLSEWARRLGISREAMRQRVNQRIAAGMPASAAITTKLKSGRRAKARV